MAFIPLAYDSGETVNGSVRAVAAFSLSSEDIEATLTGGSFGEPKEYRDIGSKGLLSEGLING
jgi:hypothetical protein